MPDGMEKTVNKLFSPAKDDVVRIIGEYNRLVEKAICIANCEPFGNDFDFEKPAYIYIDGNCVVLVAIDRDADSDYEYYSHQKERIPLDIFLMKNKALLQYLKKELASHEEEERAYREAEEMARADRLEKIEREEWERLKAKFGG